MKKTLEETFTPEFIQTLQKGSIEYTEYVTFNAMADTFITHGVDLTSGAKKELYTDISKFLESTLNEYLDRKMKKAL